VQGAKEDVVRVVNWVYSKEKFFFGVMEVLKRKKKYVEVQCQIKLKNEKKSGKMSRGHEGGLCAQVNFPTKEWGGKGCTGNRWKGAKNEFWCWVPEKGQTRGPGGIWFSKKKSKLG